MTSISKAENFDKLQMGSTTEYNRIEETARLVKAIHSDPSVPEKERVDAMKAGLWATFARKSTKAELKSEKSKKMQSILKDSKKEKHVTREEQLERSLKTMYGNGMLSKAKYISLKQGERSIEINTPLLSYNHLQQDINRKHLKALDVIPLPQINGCQRNLQQLLICMAHLYFHLEQSTPGILSWPAGNHVLLVIFGGDAAPLGRSECGTSFLISFANVKHRVASNKHNFLLVGGNCKEDDSAFLDVLRNLSAEMKSLEKQTFLINGHNIKFDFGILSSDQKFIASINGELSNSSTYPSSFADVSTSTMLNLNGAIGKEWNEWQYPKRIVDATAVAKFKQKETSRSKITKFIASRKSRQEFTPVMDIFGTKSYCEPLHIHNLAWQKWNQKLLKIVLELTTTPPKKGTLSDGSLFARYLSLLKEHKLAKLALKISAWYLEPSKSSTLNIRFTGEESKKFCWSFMSILSKLLTGDEQTDQQLVVLGFIGLNLRQAAAIFFALMLERMT